MHLVLSSCKLGPLLEKHLQWHISDSIGEHDFQIKTVPICEFEQPMSSPHWGRAVTALKNPLISCIYPPLA